MSKSLGNVVDPLDLAETYGVDPVRYFVLREVPFGGDGNYSHDGIINRINADLANDLGNLAQRSLSMVAKNCEAAVPEPGALTEADRALLDAAGALPEKARAAMDVPAPHTALAEIWAVVAEANRYFAGEEPWKLRKSDPARMNTVLYVTLETLRRVGLLVQPFVPSAAARLLDLLAVPADRRMLKDVGEGGDLVPARPCPRPPDLPALREAGSARRLSRGSHGFERSRPFAGAGQSPAFGLPSRLCRVGETNPGAARPGPRQRVTTLWDPRTLSHRSR